MIKNFTGLFTSESVSPGHPDKVCDTIADRLLDEYIRQDPKSHVAIEMLIGRGHCIIGGNVKSSAVVDVDAIARGALRDIGYISEELGASADYMAVINIIDKQSADIDAGVVNALEHRADESIDAVVAGEEKQGAGDQGMMFGYANDETVTYMPLAIAIAHALVHQATDMKNCGVLSWARPDMKSQVTVEYKDGVPVGIDTVVMSIQHNSNVSNETIEKDTIKHVILPVLEHFGFVKATRYLVNPSGRFVIGGPAGDSGVVGRKIIVDTYGGYAPHGGGAFSGKDPSKVDRSGAYMARYIAKNVVAAGLAKECQVQLSYAIGKAQPTSVNVDTFGTGTCKDSILSEAVRKVFRLTPLGIINSLDLIRPIYHLTTNYGHFGKSDPEITWEKIDKVVPLLEAVKSIKGE